MMRSVTKCEHGKTYYFKCDGIYHEFLHLLTSHYIMLFKNDKLSFVKFNKSYCDIYKLDTKLLENYTHIWTVNPISESHMRENVYEKIKIYPNNKLYRTLYPKGIENGRFLEVSDVF